MNKNPLSRIPRAFMPNRVHYFYALCKLRSDPAYQAISAALSGTAPILDVGCGIGLLAHYLRAAGIGTSYTGVDNDAGKIASAQHAARKSGLKASDFLIRNLQQGLPEHQGSVILLDVLHYLPPPVQNELLRQAAASLSPTGQLIIRTGLNDAGWRSKITHAVDSLAHIIRWMNTAPARYPRHEELKKHLRELGLQARFSPLWGKTPFNNWLIVASRPAMIFSASPHT